MLPGPPRTRGEVLEHSVYFRARVRAAEATAREGAEEEKAEEAATKVDILAPYLVRAREPAGQLWSVFGSV